MKVKVLEGVKDITNEVIGNDIVGKDGKKLDREVITVSGTKATKKKKGELVGENGRPLVKIADKETRIDAIRKELYNLIMDELDFPLKWIMPIGEGIFGYIVRSEIYVIPIGQPEAPESMHLADLGMSDLASIYDYSTEATEVQIKELLEYNEMLKEEPEEVKELPICEGCGEIVHPMIPCEEAKALREE